LGTVGANITTFANSGLTAGTTYSYRVCAANGGGSSLFSNEVTIIVGGTSGTSPATPSGLTASTISSKQINLSWNDNSNNESNFKVERKTGATGTYTQIALLGAGVTSYASSGLASNTTYYYRVRASNTSGDSTYSNESSAKTLEAVPAAPTSLAATAVSGSQVDLQWSDNSTNETGFRIERKTGSSGVYASIATVGAGSTTYSDIGLAWGTQYFYRVYATNSAGSSPSSNEAQASTVLIYSGVLDGGASHSVALKDDGTVWAWGSGTSGQLGNGASTNVYKPQAIGLGGVTAVAAGRNHTLALMTNGTVRAWGYNGYGNLGDGSSTTRNIPVATTISAVSSIDAGTQHSVALKSNGTVWSWGQGSSGQLGSGSSANSSTPVQASGLSGVSAVVAGGYHTVALKNGTVWAWGDNRYGQLGNGTTVNSMTPIQVPGVTGVTSISAGEFHTVVCFADGTVKAWGQGSSGKLGNGATTNSSSPVSVLGLTDAIEVKAGKNHTVALRSNGTLCSWGYNGQGQLGDGTLTTRTTPVSVLSLSRVVGIGCGENHTVALRDAGGVYTWGMNTSGQLGNGSTTQVTSPGQISGIDLIGP
jgi:alpha-tubulin suppressor-like RCC1 family protein